MRINRVTYEKLKTPLKVNGNLNNYSLKSRWIVAEYWRTYEAWSVCSKSLFSPRLERINVLKYSERALPEKGSPVVRSTFSFLQVALAVRVLNYRLLWRLMKDFVDSEFSSVPSLFCVLLFSSISVTKRWFLQHFVSYSGIILQNSFTFIKIFATSLRFTQQHHAIFNAEKKVGISCS